MKRLILPWEALLVISFLSLLVVALTIFFTYGVHYRVIEKENVPCVSHSIKKRSSEQVSLSLQCEGGIMVTSHDADTILAHIEKPGHMICSLSKTQHATCVAAGSKKN